MQKIPVRHINTTQKEPDLSGIFSIRDVAGMLAGNDMEQALHRHDFFFVLALKKGEGTHDIDFTPYTIGDNTIFVMRPGQVHSLLLKAGSTGFLMQFRQAFYFPHDKASNRLLHNAGNANQYQLTVARFKKLFDILTYIYDEHNSKQEKYQDVIRANMGILFIELLREQKSKPIANTNLYAQERLEEFFELLNTHVVSLKQVSHYATMMNLSPYQLNAITKAMQGKTCSQLIDEHIILEAKRYLLATPNQVNQVAGILGYEDVSYFTRFFKKHTGHTPEAFRSNYG